MTTPDARTATTLRLEQNSIGARIVHSLLWSQGASRSPPPPCAAINPPTPAWSAETAATLLKPERCLGPDAPVSPLFIVDSTEALQVQCLDCPASNSGVYEEADDVDSRRRRA